MSGERRQFNEGLDATRRTRLANERTYLAWWRTGLTALAVSFAVGKLVPELSVLEAGDYPEAGRATWVRSARRMRSRDPSLRSG